MKSSDWSPLFLNNRRGMKVEIDRYSGFCGGVIRAIKKAEGFMQENPGSNLFSLGAIVHNDAELDRLHSLGLITIDYEDLGQTDDAGGSTLLIRAHGEPPQTYMMAERAGFNIVDCTCPVVLDLQKSIRKAYEHICETGNGGQIIIFGKTGHAEVLGLMGQAGSSIVVEDMAMLEEALESGRIDPAKPVEVFSQTTKSPSEYVELCNRLTETMAGAHAMDIEAFKASGRLVVHNTICTQVASRQVKLSEFAARHDVIVFVSGKASSNGRVLSALCRKTNIRSYHIESVKELKKEWFRMDDNVGVCGATSTPRWLLEDVASKILEIGENFPNFA